MDKQKQALETLAIHGEKIKQKPAVGDPVVYPQVDSTVFRMGEVDQDGEMIYTRHDNPNRQQLEVVLASLERGEACAAFASGMAAATAIVQALQPGDHVLIPEDLYHGTRTLVTRIMKPWGVEASAVDMSKPDKVIEALRPETRLVWVETPSNPLLQIIDIQKIADICRMHEIQLVVDNTWPSPVNQQPLELGASLVMHSTSKYIGGHSDLLGGAVISGKTDPFFDKVREIQRASGAVPSPRDCWLMLRSVRTLPWRMRGHNENAAKVADFLKNHSNVTDVYYPGLPDHPGYKIASRQMTGYGGMISFLVDGDRERTARVVQHSALVAPVTSLGGVESTWEHRIRTEGPESGTPDNLVRLSVGLEHPDDLIEDIDQALQAG